MSKHMELPAGMTAAQQQHELQNRLAALNRVAMVLTRSSSLDELWRNAVAMGIDQLGFDRLGLCIVEPDDPTRLYGTYGTAQDGQVVAEQNVVLQLQADNWLMALTNSQNQSLHVVQHNIALIQPDANAIPNVVGRGWNIAAALWDGEQIVGYLFADNLLHQRAYTAFDGELLALYAGTIGHIGRHLRIAESLRASHQAEHNFRTRLAKLTDIAAKLMRSPTLDALYRHTIELGRSELRYDRLGLWLLDDDDPTFLVGTYGTWLDGTLKDERHLRVPAQILESLWDNLAEQRGTPGYRASTIITTPDTDVVGQGWMAVAPLRDGEKVIGYISTDNLLTQQAYVESDGELLIAYANMIGHLITRQRNAEALRTRQIHYQALLTAIPDMIFVLTKDGFYQDYYAQAMDQLYATPEQFVGKHVSEVMPPILAEQVLAALRETYATRRCVSLEYTLELQGERRTYDARLVKLDETLILTLVRDVTDHKRLEEQLSAAQKMESLGRMASGIAHDFNNILTVIQGYSSLVQWQLEKAQVEQSPALTKIVAATEKGMRLTNQLLSFARKQVVVPQIIDIREMLTEMDGLIRQILGDEIALSLESPTLPMSVKIDPGQLEQIILNLSTNARDAMTAGGTFHLSCRRVTLEESEAGRRLVSAGTYVLLEARDMGTGIEEELLKNIFEPFFTTKASGKGTGLGLSICHGIVQQSGGHILVESALSVGTTFRIFLPYVENITRPLPLEATAKTVGKETILIVEDDTVVCDMVTSILTYYGYTVLAYSSAIDALQFAKKYPDPIHLLMTDMMMPEMNGQQIAEAILQIYPDMPILIVSGYAGKLPEQFVNMPNIAFLAKPYKANDLAERVRSVLDRHAQSTYPIAKLR